MVPFGETAMCRDPQGSTYKVRFRVEIRDLARQRSHVRHARGWYQARHLHSWNHPKTSALGEARDAAATGDARNTVVNENGLVCRRARGESTAASREAAPASSSNEPPKPPADERQEEQAFDKEQHMEEPAEEDADMGTKDG